MESPHSLFSESAFGFGGEWREVAKAKQTHPHSHSLTHSIIEGKMKDEDTQSAKTTKREYYKLWVLAAIILLALWSMFTASLTLKWSAGNLTHDFDSTTLHDFDVLEVEEREKVVRRMWDVYSQSGSGLPRFWSDAFHAAYEHLVSDVRSVRDSAVSEIAKMSLRSLPLQHRLNLKSHSIMQNFMGSRKMKQKESTVGSTQ